MTNQWIAKPITHGSILSLSQQGFHRIAFTDWGPRRSAKQVICVHGLTRNGRDFDPLATSLSEDFRVVCPDLAGRGESDWLEDSRNYNLLQYNLDMTVLLAGLGLDRPTWIGTSLGGLMGMALAGLPNSPIGCLVINDIAPEIPYSALSRITSYIDDERTFTTLEDAERHLRHTLSPFGPMTDGDWARMAQHSVRTDENGCLRMHHDPAILNNFRRYWGFIHFSLWRYWDQIRCPVLIVRGTESDFLTDHLAARMLERLPHAELVEFQGVGHTPTINSSDQIAVVQDWIRKNA